MLNKLGLKQITIALDIWSWIGDMDNLNYDTVLNSWFTQELTLEEKVKVEELVGHVNQHYLDLLKCDRSLEDVKTLRDMCQRYQEDNDGPIYFCMCPGDFGFNSDYTADNTMVKPHTIVTVSHDAFGDGICSGLGYYETFREAAKQELSMLVWVELNSAKPPSDDKLLFYEKTCKSMCLLVLLNEAFNDVEKSCSIAFKLLNEFDSSNHGLFHTISQLVRTESAWSGYMDNCPDDFQARFGKAPSDIDIDNYDEWMFVLEHLASPGSGA
jgi:hypothetical protein